MPQEFQESCMEDTKVIVMQEEILGNYYPLYLENSFIREHKSLWINLRVTKYFLKNMFLNGEEFTL
jgi:hypothetical protein